MPAVYFDLIINNKTYTRQFVPEMLGHHMTDQKRFVGDEIGFMVQSATWGGVFLSYAISNYSDSMVPSLPRLEAALSHQIGPDDEPRGSVTLRDPADPFSGKNTHFGIDIARVDLNMAPQEVPEPAAPALVLLALALVGGGRAGRRRQAKK